MAHDDLFREATCPPGVGALSFGTYPSLVEFPSRPAPGAAGGAAGWRDWCDDDAANSLRRLEWTYGRGIKAALVELSSSIVVRSEHSFNIDERRLSLRKHVYELAGPPTAAAAGPALAYLPIDAGDRFGRYLGFLDLRAVWRRTPLALGVLGVPGKYARDPAARVITGNYGPLFGGPAFAGTVYSMHDSGVSGALCAQASIIMALGLLADRGARLDGSHTLSFQGLRQERNPPAGAGGDCLAALPAAPAAHYVALQRGFPESR
ncbi:MAG TPA: hypothetical protein VH092_17460 [Urbifossiella sp.]|nr:hypothetical protein [Urbifossiella sp.]